MDISKGKLFINLGDDVDNNAQILVDKDGNLVLDDATKAMLVNQPLLKQGVCVVTHI